MVHFLIPENPLFDRPELNALILNLVTMKQVFLCLLISLTLGGCTSNVQTGQVKDQASQVEAEVVPESALSLAEKRVVDSLQFDAQVVLDFKKLCAGSIAQLQIAYLDPANPSLPGIVGTARQSLDKEEVQHFKAQGYACFVVDQGYNSPQKLALFNTTDWLTLLKVFRTGMPVTSPQKLSNLLKTIHKIDSFDITMMDPGGIEGTFHELNEENIPKIADLVYKNCPDLAGYYGSLDKLSQAIASSNRFNLWWD